MPAHRPVRLAFACVLALLLAACAGTVPEGSAPAPSRAAAVPSAPPPQPRLPVPEAAEAPAPAVPPEPASAKPEYQLLDQGLASWYGPGLHGRRTASGERFDRRDFTAAHRTLPFGTKVCVRSLVTGKTVMVRINDRGPFGASDRVVDLSQAAAKELGMIGLGIKPVELWQVDDDGEDCVPALGEDVGAQQAGRSLEPASRSPAPAPAAAAPLGLKKASGQGLKRK